jgi:hypothetical protein
MHSMLPWDIGSRQFPSRSHAEGDDGVRLHLLVKVRATALILIVTCPQNLMKEFKCATSPDLPLIVVRVGDS